MRRIASVQAVLSIMVKFNTHVKVLALEFLEINETGKANRGIAEHFVLTNE